MHVRWLELARFRNHPFLSFAPDPGLNVLVGANGQGKTAVLEAIHLLLGERSFRTMRVEECVTWGAADAALRGEVAWADQRRRLGLTLAPDGVVRGDGGPGAWGRAVVFTVRDLLLVGGPASVRRGYLDGVAAKSTLAHAETCRRYRVVLLQRSRLLGNLAGRADADRLLEPWDDQLGALGAEIVHRRLDLLVALAGAVRELWRRLAPEGARLELEYLAAPPPAPERPETAARLREALRARRAEELRRGATLVGPHRDDLVVRLAGHEARSYASRGEQRLVALTLRLAEAAVVARRLGTSPVLLLDDVLSELDGASRARVLDALGGQEQVLLTATDAGRVDGATVWEVRSGSMEAGRSEVLAVGGRA